MTVVLGTLWFSIKHNEAPYVFDWEHGIALHTVQGNRASSPGKGDVSWDFSSCGRNLGSILELQQDWPFEPPLVQQSKDSCLVTMDTSRRQNSSVYPKSTRDEAHFPFVGSIAIPCSTAYSTSRLTSLRNRKRFPETPVSSRYEY